MPDLKVSQAISCQSGESDAFSAGLDPAAVSAKLDVGEITATFDNVMGIGGAEGATPRKLSGKRTTSNSGDIWRATGFAGPPKG